MKEIIQKEIVTFKGYVRYFLLFCFLRLKESSFKTRKIAFYFISKAIFVLEIFQFQKKTQFGYETWPVFHLLQNVSREM